MGFAKDIIADITIQADEEVQEVSNKSDAALVAVMIRNFNEYGNIDDFQQDLFELGNDVQEAMTGTLALVEYWGERLERGIFY